MSICVSDCYQWEKKIPRSVGEGALSHYRQVYISAKKPDQLRWVVKLETQELRMSKAGFVFLPLSEEVAYKICKLFGWNTIPKSKVVHEHAIESLKPKYQALMHCFKSTSKQGFPKTCTLQLFVEGEPLPNTEKAKAHTISPKSYFRASLITIVLGKTDARGDNCIYNSLNCQLFEIDNEAIGYEGYDKCGILRAFQEIRNKEIDVDILEKILQVSSDKLAAVREKYRAKEKELLTYWSKEPLYIPDYDPEGKIERCWSTMMSNLDFLQRAILFLRGNKDSVTISKLEKCIFDTYEQKKKPRQFNIPMWKA